MARTPTTTRPPLPELLIRRVGPPLDAGKHLVEMHGGSVEAHSAGLGRGSEFAVRLSLLAQGRPEPRHHLVKPPEPNVLESLLADLKSR